MLRNRAVLTRDAAPNVNANQVDEVDFLTGRRRNLAGILDPAQMDLATEGPIVTEPFTDMLALLRDIRSEIRKQHPTQLVQCVVEPSMTIIDTATHVVKFQVAGQFVPVYHILMFNSYDQDVYVSLSRANVLPPSAGGIASGVKIAKSGNSFEFKDNEIWEYYIIVPTLSNSQMIFNGQSDTTHGMFNCWAWTTDEWAISYQPDRR